MKCCAESFTEALGKHYFCSAYYQIKWARLEEILLLFSGGDTLKYLMETFHQSKSLANNGKILYANFAGEWLFVVK